MHQLSKLLSAIITEEITGGVGAPDMPVTELTADSRCVVPGAIFVAVRGPQSDGHDYIEAAIKAGATAIVCEEFPVDIVTGVKWIKVSNSAVALGHLAAAWYGDPSRHLTLVGVTGTNGKTTIATLLYEMARQRGLKAGLLSTVENRVEDTVYPAVNTTPSPLETNKLLAEMVERGCTFAAMEVSSHGMVQHRTAGLKFSGGIFTNLTRDHLDYHGTFKAYLEAKKRFFDLLAPDAWALTNADDPNGAVMLQNTRAKKFTYSIRGAQADFVGRVIENRLDGMTLTLNGIEVNTMFSGRFNAANLTAVFGASVCMGLDQQDSAIEISRLVPVAGRFQTFTSADGVTVIVDYAHTPDALANVLSTIAEILGGRGRITTVTGAGGNRDHGKRPLMGEVASRFSQRVIVTSDNPRDEDASVIADEIVAGISGENVSVTVELDRAEAIARAVAEAQSGDAVLVAGKGHETYQEFENRRRIHFDDREEARRAVEARNNKNQS